MYSDRVKEILEEWRWARGLSLDLLHVLSNQIIKQSPVKDCGSWGKQFRHLGRVQENYIQALQSGVTKFTPDGCSYREDISKENLLEYLISMDSKLIELTSKLPPSVDWFGESWSSERHLQAMVSHEILHHGEFILYARISGMKLPVSWKDWGEEV